ncbi:MAG: response regulator [Lacrimispora celerecrescens]|nr:response regulator [Lacrimispora celerecrescens]
MLKLLIVDDEEIICNTIANIIDWHSYGITLIGTCLDGVDAYHTILDESPDIVMTDIRMPGISGLELIERISKTDLTTQFIILSGYGEFDYAKHAMKYGVQHYLLKPCEEEQIIACIQEIASKASLMHQSTLPKNLQQILVHNMISEGILFPQLPESFFDSYEQYLDLTESPCQYCCIYYLEKKNLEQCLATMNAYFEQHAPALTMYKIYISNILIFFFPNYEFDYSDMDCFLRTLSFREQTTMISYERISYPNLKSLLNILIAKLRRYDILYYINDSHIIPNFNYEPIVSQANLLIPSLRCNDRKSRGVASEELANLLGSISSRDFLMQLSSQVLINLSTQSAAGSLSEMTNFLSLLHQEQNPDAIRSYVLKKAAEITTLSITPAAQYSVFIEKTLRYLEEHVSEPNLTLKWISENYLYMNFNYVSRCFVKETQQTFSTYLTNLRIQKAKEIFASQDDEKVRNVAELVGCGNNPYYFSRIFKKCTGMTPTAYMRKINHEKTTP